MVFIRCLKEQRAKQRVVETADQQKRKEWLIGNSTIENFFNAFNSLPSAVNEEGVKKEKEKCFKLLPSQQSNLVAPLCKETCTILEMLTLILNSFMGFQDLY